MDIEITCNTDDDIIFENVSINSRQHEGWIKQVPAHDGHAVIVGGGPSVAENLPAIIQRQNHGQIVFALNGAAGFLNRHGVLPEYQVILDARRDNVGLVGHALNYLFSSQCHPDVIGSVQDVILWHPAMENLDDHLPEHGDEYALVGGGTTVGLSAMCLAYTMGFRKLHLFGYDSSHRNTLGHAYSQPLNDRDPLCKVTIGDKVFTSSLAMARQAELFPDVCNTLLDLDCIITVNADGLIMAVVDEMRAHSPLSTDSVSD